MMHTSFGTAAAFPAAAEHCCIETCLPPSAGDGKHETHYIRKKEEEMR